MASPLAVAMMGGAGGGEGPGMFGLDPAIMAAQPDIQLGQALMQGGLSTAPASPMQALARVAQAGAGSYIQHGAMSDLAKAYANTSENMAQAIEQTAPGHPLIAALRSPDPTVRMAAMQQAGKALTLLSEPQKTSPGQDVSTGNTPIYSNTGPQSGPGKIAADVQHAQQRNPAAVIPLASALTKETTENGVVLPPSGVPAGPPRIVAPTTPTAAVPPPGPQKPAGSMLPGGAQLTGDSSAEPPASFNSRFKGQGAAPIPGFVGANAAIAGAKAGAEETAKNEAQFGDLLKPQGPIKPGPGITEPIKTAAGTVIPPLKEQGPVPTNPAQLKESLPAWQKKETDWNASLAPAQQAEQRLQTIANTFKAIETGSFSSHKAAFAAGLKAIGVPIEKLNMDDPAKVQLALHENYVETLQQLKATTSRFTQMEFRVLSENKEHPDLQPSANLQMLGEDIGSLRQARDLPTDFTAAKGHGWVNPQSFEQSWLKANPLSGYVDKVKGEIGPLKGMPGAGKMQASPGASSWTDPHTGKTYQIINGVPHE